MTVIKKPEFKKSIVALVFILLLSTNFAFAQLVTNGSFENSNTGIVSGQDIEGWSILVANGINPAPVFEIVNDTVKHGNRALKANINGLGSNQWDIQAVAENIPANQGSTYYYSVWAKAEKPGAQVSLTVGNYSYTEYKALRPVTLTTEWQEYTMQYTVNDNQSNVRAPIHFSYNGNTDNVIYIDNLQIVDEDFGKIPVVVEAESGQGGSYFTENQYGDITAITTTVNYSGQTSPTDTNRIITCQVTFQDTGFYNLFARVRVGSGGFDDDSFFAGKGFGQKNPVSGSDWVFLNGLASAGFYVSDDWVDEPGTTGSGVWKWINVTKNYFPGTTPEESFYVGQDNLTKTFQFASREDGFEFDKFAFGRSDLYFTVDALDNKLPGKTTMVADSSLFYQGPPIAEGADKFLGNVMASDGFFANYWNQITPGNEGKWASIAYTSNISQWNWTGLDNLYNFAKEHDLIFKDHTLIWGQQQPSWINNLDTAQQRQYIETWIRMVGERYPDIDMVDVVNEPLKTHNPPDGNNGRANYKDALGGDGETGWDWVIKSFELARNYLPGVQLILNDYGIINDNNATTIYLEIIHLLKERDLIDGIGVQGHRFALERASNTTLKYNLDRLAETGLPVYISELDLGNLDNDGTPDDNIQLLLYQRIFPLLWEHPGVKGITLWGYLEGEMWQSSCYLILRNGSWRPAMDWLAGYVSDHLTTNREIETKLAEISLDQNYPNPFQSTTCIKYRITKPAHVKLHIYDIYGREVITLVDKKVNPGTYIAIWDAIKSGGSKAGCGTYFYRLITGDDIITKKMLLNN